MRTSSRVNSITSFSKVSAIARPALLVPSPNVVADRQTKNARVLEQAGGAVLLPEAGGSGESLYRAAKSLLEDPLRRQAMSAALRDMAAPDAAEQIYGVLSELLEKKPKN